MLLLKPDCQSVAHRESESFLGHCPPVQSPFLTAEFRVNMYCSRHCVRLALRAAVNTHRHSVQRTALYAQRTLKTSSVSAVDAIATPHLDGTPKEYSPKIQQLVNDIASLTLIEVSDLNELLKKTLNIQDVGMMSMGSMAAVPVAPPAEVKLYLSKCTISLCAFSHLKCTTLNTFLKEMGLFNGVFVKCLRCMKKIHSLLICCLTKYVTSLR